MSEDPKAGETWTLKGLSQIGHISGGAQGNVHDFYSNWSQVNEKEVKIIEKVKASYGGGFNYKIQLTESIISSTYPDGIWTVVSRCYMGEKVKNSTGFRPFSSPKGCCSPSNVCANCRAEFYKDQEAKGLRRNQWTKLWEKVQ